MRGLRHDLPTTGPAAPKPSRDRPAGARTGIMTTPTAAPPTPTARGSISRDESDKAFSIAHILIVNRGVAHIQSPT
jgi:hypothetical protein